MDLGLRVVRGPHWKWQNQDGGEGHVGTIVEIGKPGNNSTPDKTVVVQWDSGFRTNYRIGYQGSFDLRVLDNAPAGIKHPNIICDACKKPGIQGMRWKCAKCYDFDLCHECYMADKHDLNHAFMRFTNPDICTGVKVPKRCSSVKIPSKGIFPGAKVVRGPDWDWGNQDGGELQPGKVEDIRGWDSESGRSVANVFWVTTGSTNVYRLGHKGKVDIKYKEASSGGFFYRDHLPVLGETVDMSPTKDAHSLFKVGDKVKVVLEEEILKSMQEGHGGWNPRMAEHIGRVGTVHRITERGDVRVQFDGCSNRWTFHSGSLSKVQQFAVGDYVKIISDIQKVKNLQRGHGDWADTMLTTLGKTGKIVKVYADGDLRVNVLGENWTFNAKCVTNVPHGREDANNTLDRHTDRQPHNDPVDSILAEFLDIKANDPDEQPSTSSSLASPPDPDRLVREAAQGHLEMVGKIISAHADKVDRRSSGKSALQVACHQGHRDVVRFLLAASADMSQQDEDGDTALHYAVFGDQAEIAELLLSNGARVDAVNKGGCSSLHVAVNKQHAKCVQVLLRHKAHVNIQDAYGDTPLHDAMGKESSTIIDLLLSQPGINFSLKNRRGFNVLQHAALKGNPLATEKIVAKSPQTVDSKKDDGFAALHLACLNGHLTVAETLIKQGRGDLEICNNRRQTPLLLAVSQGHANVVHLLVQSGCNLKAEDENGDSCLHLAVMRHTMPGVDLEKTPEIAKIMQELGGGLEPEQALATAVACYLIDCGAELRHRNNQGKTPLEHIADARIAQMMQKFAQRKMSPPPPLVECMSCCEMSNCVTFEPCGHMIVCIHCSRRMKKCIKCQIVIEHKKMPEGLRVEVSDEDLSILRTRLQEMEDKQMCSICMERPNNLVFDCGHLVCQECAKPLKACHMCRRPIKQRIAMYQ